MFAEVLMDCFFEFRKKTVLKQERGAKLMHRHIDLPEDGTITGDSGRDYKLNNDTFSIENLILSRPIM